VATNTEQFGGATMLCALKNVTAVEGWQITEECFHSSSHFFASNDACLNANTIIDES